MAVTIQIVDDENIVALDIRRTLERLGYSVSSIASDGQTAIKEAQRNKPDLILMDIRLKGDMDGIETATAIHLQLGIPIIYLTAYSDTATLERAKHSRPFGYLIKPFEERELHSTIEIALLKHESERALNTARRKAERDNLAKTAFLADMSHEIRNALNGIVGMTDLALDTDLNAEQQEYLTTVMDSTENLLMLLTDVLDISRLESRKVQLADRPFDLTKAVAKAIRSIKPEADKKQLRTAWYIGHEVPHLISGDQRRLTQVLNNLLGNALKFTNSGTITLEVNRVHSGPAGTQTPKKEQQGTTVTLLFSVQDTGIGISEKDQESIFERYKQVEWDEPLRPAGSGLGLAICKELAEMMRGSIWVRSKPDVGSTFYFTAHFSPAQTTSVQQQPEVAPNYSLTRPLNVAVADDNLVSRKLARLLLEKQGHSCTTAENGKALLDILPTQQFDLVLTNIQMPEMGGLEAVRRIRNGLVENVKPDMPVIAVTAHAMEGDKERFLAAGMTDYIAKPLHSEHFYSTIHRTFVEATQSHSIPTLPAQRPSSTALPDDAPPLLDSTDVISRMSGDTHLVVEMWDAFCRQAPEQIEGIRIALSKAEYQRAAMEAEALAIASRNVGAMDVCHAASNCHTALLAGSNALCMRMFSALEDALAQTISLIEITTETLN